MEFLVGGLSYLLPFIAVLSVVVFIHELGHFLVARWHGVRVETFSIGFGRAIAGWTDRQGTRWQIGWLPLGGYVKFWGDENAASTPAAGLDDQAMTAAERAESFHHKPVGVRAQVVAAGPAANFLLAIVVFAFLYSVIGERQMPPRVDGVEAGSPAEAAGLAPGDRILAADGNSLRSFAEMQRIVALSQGETLRLTIERDGTTWETAITPELRETVDRFGNAQRLGFLGVSARFEEGDIVHVRHDPLTAVMLGIEETVFIVDRTFAFLGALITGQGDVRQLSGPAGIAKMSGDVAQISLVALIHLLAVLSVSIGLINLFPIPMLDGGHLLYYAYEAIRGRPLDARIQEFGFRVGLTLVLTLVVFATINDLAKFGLF